MASTGTLPEMTIGPAHSADVAAFADIAREWGQRSDISARSVLVTILGDTIAPAGGEVWLADLMTLAEPFGFSDRLVRTSMSRLLAEGWVVNERVGRQSSYSLTEHGRAESRAAARRIYHDTTTDWHDTWTLVFADAGPSRDPELHRQLGWRGFHPIRPGVYAMPNTGPTTGRAASATGRDGNGNGNGNGGGRSAAAGEADVDESLTARDRVDGLGLDADALVATARFDPAESLVATDSYREASGLAECAGLYRGFVDFYTPIAAEAAALAANPADAFACRTMVVHDLRRIRLRDPQMPARLLPPDWSGTAAFALARDLYRVLSPTAWQWVASTTELTIDPTDPAITSRFADVAEPHGQGAQ